MEQKRVSFAIAKALKEAGYPQGEIDYAYFIEDFRTLKAGQMTASFLFPNAKKADAPYAIDVWLWLWREKGIKIVAEPRKNVFVYIVADFYGLPYEMSNVFSDPEEAIIAAIEYIVDNNLLK